VLELFVILVSLSSLFDSADVLMNQRRIIQVIRFQPFAAQDFKVVAACFAAAEVDLAH
jgi:hypothetical protein